MGSNIEWKLDKSQILTIMESIKKMDEKEKLRKLYLKKRLTIKEVAKKMGWSYFKTTNKLNKYGIRKHDLGKIEIEETKIIYIAGLFDGEGSLYLLRRGKRLKICFDIGMTDKDTIETVYNWLKEGGFHPIFRETGYKGRDKRGYDRTKWKPFYRVTLNWMQEIKKLSELLLPWVITKKTPIKIAIEYISQRKWGAQYTDRDYQIANKLKQITKRW